MADEKTVVAPVPAADPAPAPTPAPVTEPQEDAAESVSVADLMSDGKSAAKPGPGEPAKPKAADSQQKPDGNPPEEQFYRSQKDVDAAFAKRLNAAKRQWERDNSAAIRLAQTAREAFPKMTDEQVAEAIAAIRDENLGFTPEQSAFLRRKGLLGDNQTDNDNQSEDDDGLEAAAELIDQQAAEIKKSVPDFDAEAFLEENKELVPQIASGEISLLGVFIAKQLPQLLKKTKEDAEAAVVGQIQGRNTKIPTPAAPSAPAAISRDYTHMPSDEFAKIREQVKRAQMEGKRVVL